MIQYYLLISYQMLIIFINFWLHAAIIMNDMFGETNA